MYHCILSYKIYPKGVTDTCTFEIHVRYIKIHVSWALPWCHTGYITRYIRDTCILDSSSRYIRIQNYDTCIRQDLRNTFRIHDGIRVSQMHPERHVSEMQDTYGIHVGYIYPERQSRYMLDTSGIHARYMMRYMYLKCIEREMYLICRRHAGYMRDTCSIHVSSEAIRIHTGYIRDSCGIHAEYMRDTYLSGVRGNVSMSSSCAAHLSGHPSPPCVQMGLLRPPRAAPSSALSWQPLSLLVYHLLVEGEAHRLFLILMCIPMYPIYILLVS